MGILSDYLTGKIIQSFEEKIKENPLYQKLTGNFLIVSSSNSELNQLLEESIKTAKTNKTIASLQDDEIIESIDKNIDILFECIVLSKNHTPLSNFLIRIKYTNDNEEHRKQIETFYKSLYEQIHEKKQNYSTLQNIQIINELGDMREENSIRYNIIDAKLDILITKAITDYEDLSYNDELNAIEEKFKNREFTIAREIALSFEEKINKSKKQEEIEKLYALIINTYLFEGGNQEEALGYFEKLIAHTKNEKKKKARIILQQIIKKDFIIAQIELDKIFSDSTSDAKEIDSVFYENQINLYFMSEDFSAGLVFIHKNKDIIDNYQYFLALMLIQQRNFKEANNLLKEHKLFFDKPDFEIQEVKIIIRSHSLLHELRERTTLDLINELKEISNEIKALLINAGDCKTKISYLHSVNAIVLAAVYDKETAKKEYEKALELDPNNYNVLKNYPYLLIDNLENMDKALEYIQRYREKYPGSLDDDLLYYSILTEVNPKQVIEELSTRKDIEIEIKIYLVHALDRINRHTDAEHYLKEMLESYDNFSVHFCAGYHYNYINKPDTAIESFIRAYLFCKNEIHYDLVFYYLLRIVCNKHYIDKMITIKGYLESRYSRSTILFKYPQYYIHILLVLNDYEDCIICCNELRENGESNDFIANAEFTCYYNTKNFQKVKQVLDENRIKYSDDILIRMAFSCASIGEYDLTKDILKKIRKPDSKEEYIIFTQLYFSIKEYQEALNIINNAYQKYPNERKIQEFFIKLVYGYHIQPQSADIANSFGACLQSYRLAEYENKIIQEISIPKNATGEEILELIFNTFPNDPDIDNKMKSICENRLPISFFRLIFRKSIFSIHEMIINSTNHQIWCTEQFEKDLSHIKESAVFIDLSSLITLELLGLLDVVKDHFLEIYFTQSVLDAILHFDNELSQPYCDNVIINYGKHDDFTVRKTSEETIITMKNRVNKLKTFVLSGNNIQVVGTILKPKRIIPKRIDGFLQNYKNTDISESDTMCFSYLADCQAMIESAALRAAFNTFENSPMSFGIDSLLKYFYEKSIISEEKYYQSLTLLIENNYKLIPISVKHMFSIIKHEEYNILHKHNRFFNIFSSPEFDIENTANMLGYLLSHIWNDTVPSKEIKFEWTDYLLRIITFNPLMNNEIGYKIINYVGTHLLTKETAISFDEYLKSRAI